MSSYIACQPFHTEAIQPHQKPLASEWESLVKILSSFSIDLSFLPPVVNNLDLSLISHHAFIWKNRSYISYSKQASLHAEPFIEAWLKYHGFDIQKMVLSRDDAMPIPFSGSADAIACDTSIYLGYGIYTSHHIANVLPSYFNAQVIDLALIDKRTPHLIDCFCPLPCGRALVYEGGLDVLSRKRLARDFTLIPVTEYDAIAGACNALVLNHTIIMPRGCRDIMDQLFIHDYDVIEIDMPQYRQRGYGCKSLISECIDCTLP
ncbi:MAG: hypothetical protein VX112_02030 [Pseudomonadota bacterium]|nr:hypothetical protein [Pseudomonadota bacterium]